MHGSIVNSYNKSNPKRDRKINVPAVTARAHDCASGLTPDFLQPSSPRRAHSKRPQVIHANDHYPFTADHIITVSEFDEKKLSLWPTVSPSGAAVRCRPTF
ncbi:hypothetical protein EVAR_40924_1 [Eumeta japonica]|uniref:Uncharacterized protein n=1 Tax=Eumeta variegata TaxID=151549 RepID=A0A4C1X7X4_EUMVA|nr:hypothetical protein EVAR_40924_1 [Eumeta japonica]